MISFVLFSKDRVARQEMQPQTDTCMDDGKQRKPRRAKCCHMCWMCNKRKISEQRIKGSEMCINDEVWGVVLN